MDKKYAITAGISVSLLAIVCLLGFLNAKKKKLCSLIFRVDLSVEETLEIISTPENWLKIAPDSLNSTVVDQRDDTFTILAPDGKRTVFSKVYKNNEMFQYHVDAGLVKMVSTYNVRPIESGGCEIQRVITDYEQLKFRFFPLSYFVPSILRKENEVIK